MTQGYFITGTDTGIGKTRITLALMHALQSNGSTVIGMKPVASGCEKTPDGLRNEDALLLQAQSSVDLPYASINPYAYEPPASPNIAAAASGDQIQIEFICNQIKILSDSADYIMVEGVGGWHVPLSDHKNTEDLAIALGLPVIFVVGLRLGCLNHALLTYEAIIRSGLQCAGWVANQIDPSFMYLQENIETLNAQFNEPLIGIVPFQQLIKTEQISKLLNVSIL